MENTTLLQPTLHVEVLLKSKVSAEISQNIANNVRACLIARFISVEVNQNIEGYEESKHAYLIDACVVVDYTGPPSKTSIYLIEGAQLDVQAYSLHAIDGTGSARRRISQEGGIDDDLTKVRVLALPNISLVGEWDSLVYDDGLPARLLRYLTRMLAVMQQPNLNLSTFNWNRLVLLHGPPGSGKSTLCRALAQKLSIRLSARFPQAVLVEVNTNAMLSKYFGESGKLIGSLFEKINRLARSSTTLVCVVIDEVETIAGSRQKATDGGECSDGLRATNQLLTELDKIRALPNIIILCTSNLIGAMDTAFLDRVDMKQLIPSPSPAAIYNIFRSCLNELIRTRIVRTTVTKVAPSSSRFRKRRSPPSSPSKPAKRRALSRTGEDVSDPLLSALEKVTPSSLEDTPSSSTLKPLSGEEGPTPLRMSSASIRRKSSSAKRSLPPDSPSLTAPLLNEDEQPTIPTYLNLKIMQLSANQPNAYGGRVWALSEKCVGFSGRTLRRLPILGLAMYTWGGECSLHDAISALESAAEQELNVKTE